MIDEDDLWRFMPELVHHQDEPIADPVCVPVYFVAKLAKENGVTVVHVGEGADELFAGYPTYVQASESRTGYWRRFQACRHLRPRRRAPGQARMRWRTPSPKFIVRRYCAVRSLTVAFGGAAPSRSTSSRLRRITTPRSPRRSTARSPRKSSRRSIEDATCAGARDELDHLIYQDLRLRLPELLLMRVDKLTMANAVEARVPFLDHELVELAMAMP